LSLVSEREAGDHLTSAHQRIDAVNPKNTEAGIMVALQNQTKPLRF
jgi:hypothetical protein